MKNKETKPYFFYCTLKSCKEAFHSSKSKLGCSCLISHKALKRKIEKVGAEYLKEWPERKNRKF